MNQAALEVKTVLNNNTKRLLLPLCLLLPLTVVAEDKKEETKAKAEKGKEKSGDSTLYLESTFVGDKEQPTVSYFIPWKDIGTPDKLHWNIEQKNDRTLDLIDRDIMVRSMSIYNELDMEGIELQE